MFNAGARPYPRNEDTQPYNFTLIFQNGAPFQLQAYNYPTEPRQESRYVSAYAQDRWSLTNRITLEAGLRYAHDNGYVPENCREAADGPGAAAFPAGCTARVQFKVFNSVAPRVHTAIDLSGDGRTVIKAGWARFDHMRQIEPELTLGDNRAAATATYRWRDLNGNRLYDVGEINLNPNGPDYVSQTGVGGTPNPNERQPKSDQFSVTFERELFGATAARVTGPLLQQSRQLSSGQRSTSVRRLQHSGDATRSGAGWRCRKRRRSGPFDHLLRVRHLAGRPGVRRRDLDDRPDGRPDFQERRGCDLTTIPGRLAVLGVAHCDEETGAVLQWSGPQRHQLGRSGGRADAERGDQHDRRHLGADGQGVGDLSRYHGAACWRRPTSSIAAARRGRVRCASPAVSPSLPSC